ncbi:GDP-mannose 4,6-dehydratase [groundwater metagenome]
METRQGILCISNKKLKPQFASPQKGDIGESYADITKARKILGYKPKYLLEKGLQEKLYLGNLDAKRDWGFAGDYVESMWLMLQQDEPDDYVVATGETHSVREFAELAFREIGIDIEWQGTGVNEKGVNAANGDVLIEIDAHYFRPTEVDILMGDPSKAKEKLGWEAKVGFEELVKMMVDGDIRAK